jgi:hypothetical protein
MSFREKTAWATLCAFLLVSLLYFVHVPRLYQPHPGLYVLHSVGICLAAFILIELVAYLVLRLRYPNEARTPKDERERLIDLAHCSLRLLRRLVHCDIRDDSPGLWGCGRCRGVGAHGVRSG